VSPAKQPKGNTEKPAQRKPRWTTSERIQVWSGFAQGVGTVGAVVVSVLALQIATRALDDQQRINKTQADIAQSQQDIIERRYAGRIAVWNELVKIPSGRRPPWTDKKQRDWGVIHIVNRSPITLSNPKIELFGQKYIPRRPDPKAPDWGLPFGSWAGVRTPAQLLLPPCTETILPAERFDFQELSDSGKGKYSFRPVGINQLSFSDGIRTWSVSPQGLAKGEYTAPAPGYAPWNGTQLELFQAETGHLSPNLEFGAIVAIDDNFNREKGIADCGEGG
jgi:hypothetical protein